MDKFEIYMICVIATICCFTVFLAYCDKKQIEEVKESLPEQCKFIARVHSSSKHFVMECDNNGILKLVK